MDEARQQFEKSMRDIEALTTVKEMSREAKEADIFQAVRSALRFVKKSEAIIDGFSEQDMARALEFTLGRGIKKKALANQAKESLKILLGSSAWLRAATANDDLRGKLHEFFAGNAELQAKLESPPASPSSEEKATSSANQARKPADLTGLEVSEENAKKLIVTSVEAIISLHWDFPEDHKTVGFDTATEASKLMYDGLTMLSGLKKQDDIAAQKVLAELDIDWVGILRFLSAMYSAKTRSTLQGRITNIVEKLSRWVPAFKTALKRTPLGKHAAAPHVTAPLTDSGAGGRGQVEGEGAARKSGQEQRGSCVVS